MAVDPDSIPDPLRNSQGGGHAISGAAKKRKSDGGGGGGDDGTAAGIASLVGSYKRGGKVKRTGLAKVHKGERVLTKKQQKRYRSGKSRE